MASESPQRGALASQINVTPLVDVMLVLLIIFMVAAPLATVDVPVVAEGGRARRFNLLAKCSRKPFVGRRVTDEHLIVWCDRLSGLTLPAAPSAHAAKDSGRARSGRARRRSPRRAYRMILQILLRLFQGHDRECGREDRVVLEPA